MDKFINKKKEIVTPITSKNTIVNENKDDLKIHKCRFCDYKGREKRYVTVHERTHTGERPIVCEICNERFISHAQLSRHKKEHDKDRKQYQCKICGRSFDFPSTLKFHVLSHDEEKWENSKNHKCSLCDFKTNTAAYLKIHVNVKHTDERPYECDLCELRFHRVGGLNMHKKVHSEDRQHTCHLCDCRYKYKSDLKRHWETHQDIPLLVCEVCSFSTKLRCSFQRHLNSHKEIHRCEICKKVFNTKSYLAFHKEIHENKAGKIYKCKDCQKEFKDKILYSDHRRTHIIYKNKECDMCGEKFTIYNLYKCHRAYHKKHPENLAFGCDKCSKIYANEEMLQKHIKSHSNCFACQHCSRTFDDLKKFKNHRVLHSGDPCQYCGVMFYVHSDKLIHEKEHIGSKGNVQFKCQECDQKFQNGPDYVVHYMEHYNQLPLACEICNRRFRLKMFLHKHIEACHAGYGQKATRRIRNKKNSQIDSSSSSENVTDSEESDIEETETGDECESVKNKDTKMNNDSEGETVDNKLFMRADNYKKKIPETTEMTYLPLAVAVYKRTIENSNAIIVVWLKKMEADVLSIAKNNEHKVILCTQETFPRTKYDSTIFAKIQFSVILSNCITEWQMYSFGYPEITSKIRNKQFTSYEEVETLIHESSGPNDLTNIMRYSEKGVYNILKDQIKSNVVVCNYKSE